MAIALDDSSVSSIAGAANLTFSHTVAGADRYLLVQVSWYQTSTAVSTITYNGVGMTHIVTRFANDGFGVPFGVSLYGMVNPPTGAHDVVIAMNNSTSMVGIAHSWTGVHQSASL